MNIIIYPYRKVDNCYAMPCFLEDTSEVSQTLELISPYHRLATTQPAITWGAFYLIKKPVMTQFSGTNMCHYTNMCLSHTKTG